MRAAAVKRIGLSPFECRHEGIIANSSLAPLALVRPDHVDLLGRWLFICRSSLGNYIPGTTHCLRPNDNYHTVAFVDEYRDADARFIDLRHFNDMFSRDYVSCFEHAPFLQYPEGCTQIGNNGWELSPADVESTAILENISGPKDGGIVLMYGSGARAGHTMYTRESIGYTPVFNVGGIREYAGNNRVFGDERFELVLR